MINPINAYERIKTEIDKSDILDAVTKKAIKRSVMNCINDEMARQSDVDHNERTRALIILNELK